MERVTEPELMTSPLQVRAYADADFSDTDKEIINHLDDFLKKTGRKIDSSSLIVDLGCGPGNISQRIALNWPSARILGVDGSKEMLKVAIERAHCLNEKFDLNRLEYIDSEISLLSSRSSFLRDAADVVVSNSLLHHIHNPGDFWMAVRNISKKGAIHFHRDLRRPFSSSEVLRIQKKYLPKAPKILIEDYIASLHAAFTIHEIKDQLDIEGLNKFQVFEVDERYVEIVGIIE